MDYYRNPHASPPGLIVRDGGLLILRLFAGLALLFYHARNEVVAGWQHVWHKTPWAYAAEITDRGFPLPEAVAIVSAVAATVSSLLLVSGLLSRISALILLVCALCGFFLYARVPEIAEKLTLYAGIYVVLLLCGPGRFSLDSLLTGRKSGSK
jgi:putative oxidoreductase